MSLNKKLNILLILTSLGYGLLFAIMILGAIFPGDQPATATHAPWYVWAAIGEVIAFMIAGFIAGFIVRKKDKELREQYE